MLNIKTSGMNFSASRLIFDVKRCRGARVHRRERVAQHSNRWRGDQPTKLLGLGLSNGPSNRRLVCDLQTAQLYFSV